MQTMYVYNLCAELREMILSSFQHHKQRQVLNN